MSGPDQTVPPQPTPDRQAPSPSTVDQPDVLDLPELPELPEQMRIRRAKRDRLLAAGRSPYPISVPRTITLSSLRSQYGDLPAGHSTGVHVSVTGRVIFLRDTGRLVFVRLREGDGTELQVMVSAATVGADALGELKTFVDIGDHLSVTGEVVTSRRGE